MEQQVELILEKKSPSFKEKWLTPTRVVPVLGMCISVAVIVLLITSMAIPYWTYYELPISRTGFRRYHGLWTGCKKTMLYNDESCGDLHEYHDIPTFLDATRAMALVGLLFVVVAVGTSAVHVFVFRDRALPLVVAGATAAISGCCILTATVIYGTKFRDVPLYRWSKLHTGFILAVVAGAVAFLASALFLFTPRVKTHSEHWDRRSVHDTATTAKVRFFHVRPGGEDTTIKTKF